MSMPYGYRPPIKYVIKRWGVCIRCEENKLIHRHASRDSKRGIQHICRRCAGSVMPPHDLYVLPSDGENTFAILVPNFQSKTHKQSSVLARPLLKSPSNAWRISCTRHFG